MERPDFSLLNQFDFRDTKRLYQTGSGSGAQRTVDFAALLQPYYNSDYYIWKISARIQNGSTTSTWPPPYILYYNGMNKSDGGDNIYFQNDEPLFSYLNPEAGSTMLVGCTRPEVVAWDSTGAAWVTYTASLIYSFTLYLVRKL